MAKPVRAIEGNIVARPGWAGATIVERGRKNVKFAHPTQPNRFFEVAGLEPLYIEGTQTEIDTSWVDALPADAPYIKKMVTADYYAFFGNGNLRFDSGMPFRYLHPATGNDLRWEPGPNIQFTNDINQLQSVGLVKQGVEAAIINEDKLSFAGAYGPGLDYQVELQAGRLKKALVIDELTTLGAPSPTIISGGNPVLMLTVQILRPSGVTIWLDGAQWGEGQGQGNAASSFDYIEFRDAFGNTLWYLDKAYARDFSTGDSPKVDVATRVRRQGGSYFVEFRVPWAWLEAAVYPVIIDPTVNPTVAAAADDVSESSGGNVEDNTNRRLNSSFPYFGARLVLNVAKDSTVNDSYLSIYGDHPSLTDFDGDWDMVAEDNAAAWSTGNTSDVSGRTLTGNAVDCSITLSTSAYTNTATSATAALDALFARASWASGNYGGIVVAYKGSTGNAQYSSYNDSSSEALKIFIDYTESGGAINLTVANWGVALPVDAATLTQTHVITVADWAAALPLEGPVALTQTHILAAADWSVATLFEGPITIAVTTNLVVADWSTATAWDAPVLTQTHVITVADWASATLFGAPTLTQTHNITVADWAVATIFEGPITINTAANLIIADWSTATSFESPVLTQAHNLGVAGWASATLLEGPVALSQTHVLAAADWSVATIFEGPITISVGGVDLVVANWGVANVFEAPALTQAHILAAADWAVATAWDGPITITVGGIDLVVAAWAVALPIEGALALAQAHNLAAAAWGITPGFEAPALTQLHILAAQDWAAALLMAGDIVLTDRFIEELISSGSGKDDPSSSGYGQESPSGSGYAKEGPSSSGYVG